MSSAAGPQRRWIDSVLDALKAEPKPIPGMIAASKAPYPGIPLSGDTQFQ
jgi:hypothetical protein